jgi:enoyl-CoA hydratase/carnithine racemase
MAAQRFTLDFEDGVARLTLTYPQRANAVDRQTIEGLGRALTDLSREAGLRALVLTGEGERVFCGGADLDELAGQTATSAASFAYDAAWDAVTGLFAGLPCLTLARINGACVGGGISLAIACDLRYAAAHAYFQYPALKNRVLPSPTDVERLVSLVGPARARWVWLGGGRVTSLEAREWGLVEKVLPLADLNGAIDELVAPLAAADPVTAVAMKRMINGGYRDPAHVERLYRAVYDRDPDESGRLAGPAPAPSGPVN